MKTPEEIKKGLEYCIEQKECRACPYRVRGPIIDCLETMHKDALAYIRQLEAKLAEYEEPLEPLPEPPKEE